MSRNHIITIVVAAIVCAALTLLPPIVGIVAFFLFAIIIRYHPSQSLPKRWLVYGALGGACLFFAAAIFIACQNGELPMAFYGLPPNKWFRFAFHFSCPIGGFVGSLIGHTTATLIRGARPRGVMTGAGVGITAATIAAAIYVAWLVSSLRGQFVKHPSVVVVYCVVVLLLLLTVGGVSGTMIGALLSRLHHRPHDAKKAT
ncbi:MAG: hypothetical protein ACYC4B_31085 [Pirellulaceae bacterium]